MQWFNAKLKSCQQPA